MPAMLCRKFFRRWPGTIVRVLPTREGGNNSTGTERNCRLLHPLCSWILLCGREYRMSAMLCRKFFRRWPRTIVRVLPVREGGHNSTGAERNCRMLHPLCSWILFNMLWMSCVLFIPDSMQDVLGRHIQRQHVRGLLHLPIVFNLTRWQRILSMSAGIHRPRGYTRKLLGVRCRDLQGINRA